MIDRQGPARREGRIGLTLAPKIIQQGMGTFRTVPFQGPLYSLPPIHTEPDKGKEHRSSMLHVIGVRVMPRRKKHISSMLHVIGVRVMPSHKAAV